MPFRLDAFRQEELLSLKEMRFGACVALVLNRLLTPKLDGVELGFTLGRAPVKLASMSHRIVVAELWHNPHWNYRWAVQTLTQRLRTESQLGEPVTEWAAIAVGIAMLFGVYAELQRSSPADITNGFDVAVTSGDFSWPMVAWYAREMGLPVGTVICGCNENGAVWDLLHHGEMRTNEVAVSTHTSEDNWAVPRGLERLIAGCLGPEEVAYYCDVCRRGGIYAPDAEKLALLRRGMFAGVISSKRVDRVISSVYRTNQFILSPQSALSYAALQDYRTTAGEGRVALLLAEVKPADASRTVAAAMGITEQELKTRLK